MVDRRPFETKAARVRRESGDVSSLAPQHRRRRPLEAGDGLDDRVNMKVCCKVGGEEAEAPPR